MSFFKELKRRNVIRMGVAYLVASWLLLQIVSVLVPLLELPLWVGKLIFLILLVGLIPTLIFSWAYEMTAAGLRRESEFEHNQSSTLQTARKLDRVTIILVLVVGGIVLIDRFIPENDEQLPTNAEQEPSTQSQPVAVQGEASKPAEISKELASNDDRQSVAVIPFINMSDDKQNEYFSDGISEELLNVLVRIKSLRVPSRTSSFTFKGSDKNLAEIGSLLGVDHVLEGSVRKAGNRIRVTAQLIEVKTDTHLWSETYTRELDDIFAVQDEIAQAIVEALKLTLSIGDQQKLADHSTSNTEAYNKFLLGQHLWHQRTVQSMHAGIKAFKEALELDPEYAEAWAALGDLYLVLPEYDFGTAEEFLPKARKAVEMALAIDPESARTLTNSGVIKAQYDFDWDGANADFQKALQLEPGYSSVHQWFGDILMPQGRTEEALEHLRLAAIANPISAVVRHTPGYYYLWTGQLDEAEEIYLSVLELDPNFRWTFQNFDMLYTMRGEYDKAREWAGKLAAMEGFDPAPDLARIDAVENPALKPRALALLAQREDIVEGVWGKAMQYALMDEYELALESLEKAFATESPWRVHMKWVVNYEPLHGNPRFQAMLKEMNLAQ